jgi:hypothetical protein
MTSEHLFFHKTNPAKGNTLSVARGAPTVFKQIIDKKKGFLTLDGTGKFVFVETDIQPPQPSISYDDIVGYQNSVKVLLAVKKTDGSFVHYTPEDLCKIVSGETTPPPQGLNMNDAVSVIKAYSEHVGNKGSDGRVKVSEESQAFLFRIAEIGTAPCFHKTVIGAGSHEIEGLEALERPKMRNFLFSPPFLDLSTEGKNSESTWAMGAKCIGKEPPTNEEEKLSIYRQLTANTLASQIAAVKLQGGNSMAITFPSAFLGGCTETFKAKLLKAFSDAVADVAIKNKDMGFFLANTGDLTPSAVNEAGGFSPSPSFPNTPNVFIPKIGGRMLNVSTLDEVEIMQRTEWQTEDGTKVKAKSPIPFSTNPNATEKVGNGYDGPRAATAFEENHFRQNLLSLMVADPSLNENIRKKKSLCDKAIEVKKTEQMKKASGYKTPDKTPNKPSTTETMSKALFILELPKSHIRRFEEEIIPSLPEDRNAIKKVSLIKHGNGACSVDNATNKILMCAAEREMKMDAKMRPSKSIRPLLGLNIALTDGGFIIKSFTEGSLAEAWAKKYNILEGSELRFDRRFKLGTEGGIHKTVQNKFIYDLIESVMEGDGLDIKKMKDIFDYGKTKLISRDGKNIDTEECLNAFATDVKPVLYEIDDTTGKMTVVPKESEAVVQNNVNKAHTVLKLKDVTRGFSYGMG